MRVRSRSEALRTAGGVVVATGVGFLLALWLHDKGLVAAEEGLVLTEAEAILRGQVLYRDIDCFVTPGVWYVAALILALTEHSLNATRVVMAALFALEIGVLWAITRHVASGAAAWFGSAVVLVLRLLAFPLGSFIWYTEFAIFFAFLALAALLTYERRGGRLALSLAGAAVGFSILFKQNLGGALLLALLAFLFHFHRTRRELTGFLVPVALPGSIALVYFAAVGALPQLLRELLYVPFASVPGPMGISYLGIFSPQPFTPQESYSYWPILFWEQRFLDPGWGRAWLPVARGIGLAVYAAPLLLAAWVALRSLRLRTAERTELLLLAVALAIFVSAFPRSDFAHVAQTLPGFVPLVAHLLRDSLRGAGRRRIAWLAAAPAILTVAAFCGALILRLPYTARLEHPKARVHLSELARQAISSNLEWIETVVPPDEMLAIIPAAPIYYFLSGRPVPFRYTVMFPPNVGFDGGADVTRLLEERDVRYVFYASVDLPGMTPFESYAPVLNEYLRVHYRPVAGRRFRGWRTMEILVRRAAG